MRRAHLPPFVSYSSSRESLLITQAVTDISAAKGRKVTADTSASFIDWQALLKFIQARLEVDTPQYTAVRLWPRKRTAICCSRPSQKNFLC